MVGVRERCLFFERVTESAASVLGNELVSTALFSSLVLRLWESMKEIYCKVCIVSNGKCLGTAEVVVQHNDLKPIECSNANAVG